LENDAHSILANSTDPLDFRFVRRWIGSALHKRPTAIVNELSQLSPLLSTEGSMPTSAKRSP